MKPFLRYLLLTLLLLVVTGRTIPRRYQIEFPRQPGPKFDSRVRNLYIDKLNAEKPDIVLLGDSMVSVGVDSVQLSELTGMTASNFDVPGSSSALWYLILKNNIVVAEHLPRAVVIVFRDTVLTAPGYRVHGSYFIQLDEFAYRKEKVLLERAYLNLMNPLEYGAEKYLPLYGARVDIRLEVDAFVRYALPARLGCDVKCIDGGFYRLFAGANLEPGQLQAAIASADQYLYDPSRLDFKSQASDSFLPEMIRLARESGIQLILVRLKSQRAASDNAERLALKGYIGDLSDYLAQSNAPFLDYGEDPRLKPEHYIDSVHLNAEGRAKFTQILADGLIEALK